jgi:hypothetical protein
MNTAITPTHNGQVSCHPRAADAQLDLSGAGAYALWPTSFLPGGISEYQCNRRIRKDLRNVVFFH